MSDESNPLFESCPKCQAPLGQGEGYGFTDDNRCAKCGLSFHGDEAAKLLIASLRERVKVLEAQLKEREQVADDTQSALTLTWERAEKAEARVKELESEVLRLRIQSNAHRDSQLKAEASLAESCKMESKALNERDTLRGALAEARSKIKRLERVEEVARHIGTAHSGWCATVACNCVGLAKRRAELADALAAAPKESQ